MKEKNTSNKSCCTLPMVEIDEGGGIVKDSLHRFWIKIVLSIILAGQSMVFALAINISEVEYGTAIYYLLHGGLFAIAVIVTVLLGGPLFKETIASVREFRASVETLFTLSALGALVSSLVASITGKGGIYYEVVSIVMIIYSIGKTISMQSRNKVEVEINKARENFNQAFVRLENGEFIQKDISSLRIDDVILVKPGGAISVDGQILSGSALVRETIVNGEIEPTIKNVGDYVYAGSYAVDGSLEISVRQSLGNRVLDSIFKTIEGAKMMPSRLQAKADQIMQWFLPLVLSTSIITFLYWTVSAGWTVGLLNSMSVLLVACPCALGLATPIAVWGGLWKLSSLGLVVRTGRFMDALVNVNRVIFDKTGTLSEEDLKIVEFKVVPESTLDIQLLTSLVQFVQRQINHPIARAFLNLSNDTDFKDYKLLDSTVVSGKGVIAKVEIEGKSYLLKIGVLDLMDGLFPSVDNLSKKVVYISCNGKAAGYTLLEETVREDSIHTIESLLKQNIKVNILSGDPDPKIHEIAGVPVESGLSSEDKISIVKDFLSKGETLIYVGDGMNDAGAMSLCNGSIAMGSGTPLTCSTASSIFKGKNIGVILKAISLAQRVNSKIKGNMIFALTYNILGIGFAMLGRLHPVIAALIMLVSSALVSIRALRSAKI